jgi:uncharacterized protein YfkK (UPF0435 family)
MNGMSLEKANPANLAQIVNEIKASLKVVNAAIIAPADFRLSDYEDLYEIYQMIQKKAGRLTMMEVEGVLDELGAMRKAHR